MSEQSTTTAAATAASETTTAVTTVNEPAATTEITVSNNEPPSIFTLEDYGWVMDDVCYLMDMNAVPEVSMAFILHVDRAMLGQDDKDNEIVFLSLDEDDMIYGEYVVNVRDAADPALETLPSGAGEDIVAVPVKLRDIIRHDKLDLLKVAKFYITKNFRAIKKITLEEYDGPQQEGSEPEYSDTMIADMSERYYKYFTGHTPEYPDYEHFYTDDTVTSVYNVSAPTEYGNPVTTIYTIDKRTAKGHDQNGNPVNLTQFKDGTPSDPDEPETYETGSFAYQRRLMKFEGALFGVRFMGWDLPDFDLKEQPGHLIDILNDTGTGEALGLYIGYPEENVIQTENGFQLFFIIPRSSDCKVEVKTDDNGETIYSGDGAPIILKCNEMLDDTHICTVYITDPDGNTVSWCPRLITVYNDLSETTEQHIDKSHPDGLIHDFSDYNNMNAVG